jgi:tRNA(fMet)-specific endonuclease VapC
MACLDTNVIIEFLKGNPKIVNLLKDYSAREEISSTVITKYELGKYSGSNNKRADFSAVENIRMYPLDTLSAIRASEVFSILKSRGKMINENDILIAGIAMANGETLITTDRDFRAIGSEKIVIV